MRTCRSDPSCSRPCHPPGDSYPEPQCTVEPVPPHPVASTPLRSGHLGGPAVVEQPAASSQLVRHIPILIQQGHSPTTSRLVVLHGDAGTSRHKSTSQTLLHYGHGSKTNPGFWSEGGKRERGIMTAAPHPSSSRAPNAWCTWGVSMYIRLYKVKRAFMERDIFLGTGLGQQPCTNTWLPAGPAPS